MDNITVGDFVWRRIVTGTIDEILDAGDWIPGGAAIKDFRLVVAKMGVFGGHWVFQSPPRVRDIDVIQESGPAGKILGSVIDSVIDAQDSVDPANPNVIVEDFITGWFSGNPFLGGILVPTAAKGQDP